MEKILINDNNPNILQNSSQKEVLHNEDEFQFFWKFNDDPWDESQKPIWVPYDLEDQCILIAAYKKYLENNSLNEVSLKDPSDHYVDFKELVQINKNNSKKKRPIQRCHPNIITNIFRINRFYTHLNSNIKADFIEKKTLTSSYFSDPIKTFFKNSKEEKTRKINKIYFKVFEEFSCELDIEEQLCFFEDETIINVSFEKLKSIIIFEIRDLGGESQLDSAKKYISHIEDNTDYKSFFQKIVHIYTLEGYLYKNVNDYLRKLDKLGFEKIKYFYTCLLASFKYFSLNNKLDKDKDLIVYRASKCLEEEFLEYNKQGNSNIVRIFKDFISTSSDPEVAISFFTKLDPSMKEFFWEITIPKVLIEQEAHNFADISNYSNFKNEKEILIRSGVIIQIDKIIPYTEEIDGKIIEYPNKFKKICTLKSFSLASFYKLISIDPSIKTLDLKEIKIGEYQNNMLYIKEVLENNNSINTLELRVNKLGSNEKNMLHLKEALEKNNSIQDLGLYANNLGYNENNMYYLKEILIKNKTIQKLGLYNNDLGINENNILYLKEGLANNNSIQLLYLGRNDLGRYENNMLYLKDGLAKNNSLITLGLYGNNLGINEKNMFYLKEGLKINKSVQKLYLGGNRLGENVNNMLYLKETLEVNISIQEVYLAENNLGINENNMLYLKDALENNNSIQILELQDNQLGGTENNIIYLREALEISNSIKILDLRDNKLNTHEEKFVYLKNKGIKYIYGRIDYYYYKLTGAYL